MEGENQPRSLLEYTIMCIENSMKDIESEDKKKEILDFVKCHNKLKSKEELYDTFFQLGFVVKHGDLALLKILLSETVFNDSKDFMFKIDKENKTASLFKISGQTDHVIIPRSFQYESEEYLITSVCNSRSLNNSEIKIIEFDSNSAVRTIYGGAFSPINNSSSIHEIHLPSSLIELKEGWCAETKNLTKIFISQSNNNFMVKDNKYLFGKSDNNKDEFDVLEFVARDTNEITILSNIKIIASFAFDNAKINSISIPSNVTRIGEYAFRGCQQLTKVEIPTNSNLQMLEEGAFSYTSINTISIPANVSKLSKKIFFYCRQLTKVEIPTNSKLKIIESNVFNNSNIDEIYLPSSLIELKEGWCNGTKNLTKIFISQSNNNFMVKDNKYLFGKSDNNKDEFDVLEFVARDTNEFTIPSNIKIIASNAFQFSKINSISIPSNVTKIFDIAFTSFEHCKNLTKVDFEPNSNLQIIEESAFQGTNIKVISIPSSVSKIDRFSFAYCKNLKKVEFQPNSNLKIIESKAFSKTNIKQVFIPSSVSNINEEAFDSNLQIIEISENTKLQPFPLSSFANCSNLIVMIPRPSNGNI